MSDNTHFPWNEGQPTKPDVDALLKAFPPDAIVPGWHVTDEEVKQQIGRCDGQRYRTVYDAWVRRLASDHSILLYRQAITGFFCPTPEDVYSRTHPSLKSARRKIGKQLRGVSLTKPENDIQAQTKDHQGRLLYTSKRELKKACMSLVLPSTAALTTPQISPPADKRKG